MPPTCDRISGSHHVICMWARLRSVSPTTPPSRRVLWESGDGARRSEVESGPWCPVAAGFVSRNVASSNLSEVKQLGVSTSSR